MKKNIYFTVITLLFIMLCFSGCAKVEQNSVDNINQRARDYVSSADKKIEAGDNDGALEDVIKALKEDSTDSFYHWKKGQIENNLGKYKDAIKDTTKAIELDVNDPYAYFFRAVANNSLGQKDLSEKDFIKAKEIFTQRNDKKMVKMCDDHISSL